MLTITCLYVFTPPYSPLVFCVLCLSVYIWGGGDWGRHGGTIEIKVLLDTLANKYQGVDCIKLIRHKIDHYLPTTLAYIPYSQSPQWLNLHAYKSYVDELYLPRLHEYQAGLNPTPNYQGSHPYAHTDLIQAKASI